MFQQCLPELGTGEMTRGNGTAATARNTSSARGSFLKVRDGSIITLFDKTPAPSGPEDVICPHFIELKWANGCNFDCAWCYLNGTFRFRPMGKKPYMKDFGRIKEDLLEFFDSVRTPALLNSGELSDSLVFEGNGSALTKHIVPLFQAQELHKLLIVTKSANVDKLLKTGSQDRVVVSFSVNALKVARKWEKKAPSPSARIRAAAKLHEAGYTVRLRLDPVVPITGWEEEYREVIDYIFSNFTPERITLGSLRGLQSTINFSEDTSWTDYLDDRSNWGKKIGEQTRYGLYKTIIGHLRKEHGYRNVGLCKETVAMWKRLGMDHGKMKCNCTL